MSRCPTPLSARFGLLVVRGAADACWPWQGRRDGDGFGRIHHGGQDLSAQRVAYELATGVTLLPSVVIAPRCEHRRCCNPAHLVPVAAPAAPSPALVAP